MDRRSILDQGINGCGRGINAVVIDPLSRSIVSVSNHDTYDKESTSLETLLLGMREGELLLLLTFDEPSSKLSPVARLLLHEMGSGKAQNLNYRTSWYLVTQKGISGYSPYEEIHLPAYNASQPAKSVWAAPHDVRMCLPLRCTQLLLPSKSPVLSRSPCILFPTHLSHLTAASLLLPASLPPSLLLQRFFHSSLSLKRGHDVSVLCLVSYN